MFATKSAVLALTACLLIGTVVANEGKACASEINVYLSAKVMTCTEGIPVQRFYNPRLQAKVCFDKQTKKTDCTLDQVPGYLEGCLNSLSISSSTAKACMQSAISILQ